MSEPRDLTAHLRYYQDLGVTGLSRDAAWRSREAESEPAVAPGAVAALTAPAPADAAAGIEGNDVRLRVVRAEIGDCTRCKLHAGRTQIVFGVGNPEARLMFVGEGPGADEDEQGEPFVGRAGQLLTQIIKAMGFAREEVYIANVVKCRPPANRPPTPFEAGNCKPFLFKQIELQKPRAVVLLGATAARHLAPEDDRPMRDRVGRLFELPAYSGVVFQVLYHPAFLLRDPRRKPETFAHAAALRARLDQELFVSERAQMRVE